MDRTREEPPEDLIKRIKRIGAAPRASREELLEAVFGEDEVKSRTVLNGLLHGTAPPAAEWIDLADAGPYVDETEMPLYSPNGDGSGGERSYDDEETDEWMRSELERIGKRSSASHAADASDATATDDATSATRAGGDTELQG